MVQVKYGMVFVKLFPCLFLTSYHRTELCQSVLIIPTFIKALGAECYCLCSCAVHSGI